MLTFTTICSDCNKEQWMNFDDFEFSTDFINEQIFQWQTIYTPLILISFSAFFLSIYILFLRELFSENVQVRVHNALI